MSRDNVELIRRTYDAFDRGALDELSGFHDPQIEWRTASEDPDAGIHRGPEAVRHYIEQWLEGFAGLRATVEEYIDAGDDRVFTWVRWTGRGRASGIDAEWWLAIVYTVRGGKVVHADEYFDRAQALEFADLPG